MGRKHWTAVALALCVVALSLRAGVGNAKAQPRAAKLDKVTLQLKWVTQSQFAGYYAAVAKGYYKAFGLDVKLKVGGPSITPETGRGERAGAVRHRLAAEPPRNPRHGHEPREHRPDVRPCRHDGAHLEGQRHQFDRCDEGQDRRRLVLRQPVRALRGADEVRHGPREAAGCEDLQPAVHDDGLPQPAQSTRRPR